MKIGIFSDVHGNLEALDAVLIAMRHAGVERYWCLGDTVGYGADPNACSRLVRDTAHAVVLGNHDAACVGAEDPAKFNPNAQRAVAWTAERLEPEHRTWLRQLPLTESISDNLLVHASPHEPANWHYIHTRMKAGDVVKGFAATQARCAFVGHSHQQLVLVRHEEEFFRFLGTALRLEEGRRYLVNVGSVGQPRDRDPRAAWALYDTDTGAISLERTPYDIPTAQRKIRDAGLPPQLADRLETGS